MAYSASGPDHWSLRLGKKAARPGAVKFRLTTYVPALETPPQFFRFKRPPVWRMFANDRVGDCVWAGAAHETQLWEIEGGQRQPRFSDASVLHAYHEVTGYNPSDPQSDQGTDMATAAEYRRTIGIPDASGKRHTVDAYVAVPLGDAKTLKAATWLFGGLGLGFRFYEYNMAQFKRNQPWAWENIGAQPDGGHYVPIIGYQPNGNLIVVSWGKEQEMTPDFAIKAADEIFAYVDLDRLSVSSKLTPEGFNREQLLADLGKLTGAA